MLKPIAREGPMETRRHLVALSWLEKLECHTSSLGQAINSNMRIRGVYERQ
jgi:hypothetical protein